MNLAQELKLPWPPSLNAYYRSVNGRVLISKRGREYRHLVAQSRAWQAFPAFDASARLYVEIHSHPPHRRRYDLDNQLKCVLDSLQHAGVFPDDSQIDDLRIIRSNREGGGLLRIIITEIAPGLAEL